ncbi:exosome complex component MTR3-like [Planococcus citri]|uniref:exosome complex component MTR3-like n=1 Tax=Planococcus citri TaxID=170843 RepID=UPI0031F94BB8
MPPDTRRITAPFTTTDYRVYSINKSEKNLRDTITHSRPDGRQHDEHRSIVMKTGVISHAKGSAYVEYDKTKVICSVFDPREIPNRSDYSLNGELYCEFKFAPFSCEKRRGYLKDAEEREHSINLRRALEPAVMRHQFSNFQVDIYVLVIENDGSCLAAAITCANLALANASVPMHDLVTGVSLGLFNDCTLIDPNRAEELCCMSKPFLSGSKQGTITVSYMKTLEQITEIVQSGVLNTSNIENYVEILIKENAKVYELARQCLVRSVLKYLKDSTEKERDAA